MADDTRQPPPEVQRAAAIVDAWLKNSGSVLDTGGTPQSQPQPRAETAAERFKRARDIDQSQMPAWRDPRTANKGD